MLRHARGLLLALGYFLLAGFIAYVAWKANLPQDEPVSFPRHSELPGHE